MFVLNALPPPSAVLSFEKDGARDVGAVGAAPTIMLADPGYHEPDFKSGVSRAAALARELMATRHRKVRLGPHHAHDARGLATDG